MQRGDQRIVDLQHRLAASQHDIAVRVAPSPGFGYHRRARRRIAIFSDKRAVRADESGIAEPACRLGPTPFAPAPPLAHGTTPQYPATPPLSAPPPQAEE